MNSVKEKKICKGHPLKDQMKFDKKKFSSLTLGFSKYLNTGILRTVIN